MAIEGGHPHFQVPTGDSSSAAAAAVKSEGTVRTEPEATVNAPSIIAQTQISSDRKIGYQDGATRIDSARSANDVAKPILLPRPPTSPSPRRPKVAPKVAAEPQAQGEGAPLLEPINAKQVSRGKAPPGVPDFREGIVSKEEHAAFKKRLAERQAPPQPGQVRLPSSSKLLKPGSIQNLTTAVVNTQEKRAAARAARTVEIDPKVHHEQMQKKVDDIYNVISRCIEEGRTPILKNGVLKVGSSKGKGPLDRQAYEHIGNTFKEAYTSTYMGVIGTHGESFPALWHNLTKGINEPSFKEIDQALKANYPKPRQGMSNKESISRDEIFDNILAGDAETAEMVIFSHRESDLTARPFASLLEKLQQVDHPSTPKEVKLAAYQNALAFTSLYLEMGVSIPADPAKKAELKGEIQTLLQHIASHTNNASLLSRVKETRQATVSSLQAPAEKDVLFAFDQARHALRTTHDVEGALRTLELARGRNEESILLAKEFLLNELKSNPAIQYHFQAKSAKEMANDLGAHIEYTFRAMRPGELELNALKAKARASDAPAITEEMENFNRITAFLKSEILSAQPDNVAVAKAMAKVVDIGNEAMKSGNYALAMCVHGTFALQEVSTLLEQQSDDRELAKHFTPSKRQQLEELTSFCSNAANFKNYRAKLNSDRAAGKPVIPFLSSTRQEFANLEAYPMEIDGKLDQNFMGRLMETKRDFAQDLRRLKQRPIPVGNPAISVVLMRQNVS